jgi:tetratricopeptide (TPR) repeat protein
VFFSGLIDLLNPDGFTMTLSSQNNLTIDQAMTLASQLQSNSRLQEAEHLLQQILQQRPQHAFALHLLGVIAHQCGKQSIAAELIQRAIISRGDVALFHANLSEISRQLKRLDKAIEHGERAVALEPRLAMAHSNLGIAYFDNKEYDKAEACQQRALALDPAFAPSLNNLGSIYREREDKKNALHYYQKAADTNPNYLEPLNNLGALLLEEDRIPEAIESLNKALRLHPNYAESICNMGGIHLAQEELDEALTSFRRALELRPVYLEAQMGLSKTLQAKEMLPEAEQAAIRALQIDGHNPKGHALMGSIYAETERPEQAEQEFKRALELKPSSEEGLLGLGHLCVENGELDRAKELFVQVLTKDPDSTAAHIQMVQAYKVKEGDPHFAAVLKEFGEADKHSDNRKMSLHFALGKCYDDTKQYDQAFPHFLEGCKLKRAKFNYDADATARQFAELKEIFSQPFIDRLRGSGDPSYLPIFVLGMPRSGTTLTEQIIASHPDVYGAGELPDLLRIAHRKTDPETTTFPDNLRYLDADTLKALGAEYVAAVQARAPDARHITDKMPANFFAVPLIHLMLPNAKIIHVNRNPVDTCVSCFTRLFHRKQEHTYDLAELGRYYVDYARLMDHWRKVLPAGAFYDVQYEAIVADQEAEARKLLDYCGLEWNDACLEFHKTKRQVRTASVTQVRQPIYTTSVERWRKYEKFLGPLLDELGDLVPAARS